ncbi:DUF1275 domain-containing protein [Aminipila butyrica]|uniref:DUF1275 domain-containing protein n=2 Tax=Aminipila butyrica TaxID=433296 RepID=A0A858C1W2_9FIRM|nr:DUF1275 domain-containing protein [Aminipila butyrica]
MSESYLLGALLAAVGGYLDAYTYVCRGQVFANAQTGNMVLMGIQLAQGHVRQALYYLVPILTFFVGICFVELLRHRCPAGGRLHWRQGAIAIEFVALAAVAFLPQESYNPLAIIVVSFVCAVQAQSFRKFNGNAFASTMCTGNLRSASEHFYRFTSSRNRQELYICLEYLLIIGFFILGAGAGCFLTRLYDIKAVWLVCVALALAFVLMVKRPAQQ